MKVSVMYIWSNRGRTLSILQKLVEMPKIIQSQDSKTTFKQNLTCIFLPVRANLKYTLCHEGPCIYSWSICHILENEFFC